eukprot:11894221-Karenia_brevis.AAC.1
MELLPGICILPGNSHHGPFLFSTGFFDDDGFWQSAQPCKLPTDQLGQRRVLESDVLRTRFMVKQHIRQLTASFRKILRQRLTSAALQNLRTTCSNNVNAKVHLLLRCFLNPGPPLHIAISWAGPPSHQAAVSCLLCGDLGLGRYAANYFAQEFCPKPWHAQWRNSAQSIDPTRICLPCWYHRRT